MLGLEMTAKGIYLSSSVVEVFLDKRPTLEEGKISLLLFSKTGSGSTQILSQDYSKDVLSFIFDISEVRPLYVSRYNLAIEIKDNDGISIEEVKLRDTKGKIDALITGAVKKVIHDFIVVAKNINGSKVFLFKKMSSGERCQQCWDYDLDSSTNSDCPTCGGTGQLFRYSKPYITYGGALQSSSISRQHAQEGMIADYGETKLSLPALVELRTDDIVYYQILGLWFIVNSNLTISGLKSIDTLQTILMNELPSHSPQIKTLSMDDSFTITNKWR
jgi:hypothetical protein